MDKITRKARRKQTVRKKVTGTTERPRLCVSKSLKNIYAQVIDDFVGKTICGISTVSLEKKSGKTANASNVKAAEILGEAVAKLAVSKGVKKVVFDRSGDKYHGVIKAFAESARKSGLEF